MRSIRVLFVLGGAAVAAALFAQSPASAYGHGHGAFATPGSRTRARTYARRAYYRAPTPTYTYASTPRTSYSQPTYSRSAASQPTYPQPTYRAPRYAQVDYRSAPAAAPATSYRQTTYAAPAPEATGRRMVDRNGNVWIERRPAARTTYVAPTYVASAPVATTRSTIEYDEAGRPWVRRYTGSSAAPAAGAGLGSAVRSLRTARDDASPRIAPRTVRVDYPAPQPVNVTYSAPSTTCFT
jgi:hypothetical protein